MHERLCVKHLQRYRESQHLGRDLRSDRVFLEHEAEKVWGHEKQLVRDSFFKNYFYILYVIC